MQSTISALSTVFPRTSRGSAQASPGLPESPARQHDPDRVVHNVNNADSGSQGGVVGVIQSASDEDLLRLCAESKEAALDELARRYRTPLYRFLVRLLNSTEDAEEAVLDVFVRAWHHAPRFQYRAKVATWLYRIAVNIARDMHSRKRARPQETRPDSYELAQASIGSAEEDALHRLQREESSQALERALNKLSESDRVLLVLYYLEEREYDEIQAITELSYTVLKTRLARARRRLKTLMETENRNAAGNKW
jgi:RNA polymerase sigma-70 factor (ECF subfamily)